MHDQISTIIQWILKEWGRKSIVHTGHQVFLLAYSAYCFYINDVEQWICRCFHPQHTRLIIDESPYIVDITHIGKCGMYTEVFIDLLQKTVRAPIKVIGCDNLITGFEELDNCVHSSHSAGKGDSVFTVFQSC